MAIFFRTWSGGNSDGPEATRDHSEATVMVWRQQKDDFRKGDGLEATCDGSEAIMMVRRQQKIISRKK